MSGRRWLGVGRCCSARVVLVQGLIAGRIPGVTGPDSEGYMTYTRPEGKSGEPARVAVAF